MSNYFFSTDFDATLIKRNSHEYLNELCSNQRFLRQIDENYSTNHLWFERMNRFYEYLAKKNVTKDDIFRQYEQIELIDGVEQLIRKFSSKNIFMSIISDGYRQIIEFVLKRKHLFKDFHRIDCNADEWIDDERQLKILPYSKDRPFSCPNRCPFNLCKGFCQNRSRPCSPRLVSTSSVQSVPTMELFLDIRSASMLNW